MDTSLAGASLCLLPATPELRDLMAGALAEHNLIFERRGAMLALVGPSAPARSVELLRSVLNETERRGVMVASIGKAGFPEQRSLDDWWKIQETGWLEQALANPFGASDPESRGPAFTVWFQAIFDTSGNRVVAHECMARVHSATQQSARHYSGSEIMDAAWLRRKEREVDNKLRQRAIAAAADRGGSGVFFINFLPHTVYEPSLCLTETFAAIRLCGLSPRKFAFEAVRANDNDHRHLCTIAETIRAAGCHLSLDDMVTSGGGIQLILDLQPDFIKLSTSLISDLESPVCASAVRKIVQAADRCGATVIAKNVEDAKTVENLWLLGVQFMQGNFFARPAPTPARQSDLFNLAAALERPGTIAYEYTT